MERVATVYRLGWGQDPKTREEAERFCDVVTGWRPLIKFLLDQLDKYTTEAHITQVKEKWGGLRFYLNAATLREDIPMYDPAPDFNELIRVVEQLSYYMCMVCGKYGAPANIGYVMTLCDEHLKEIK